MRLSLLKEVPLVYLVTRWIKQLVFNTLFHIRGTRAVETQFRTGETEDRLRHASGLVHIYLMKNYQVTRTFLIKHFWSQTLMLGWVWPQWKAKRLESPCCFISWPCTENMYSKRAFYCSNILYVVCFGRCTLIYLYKHYSVTLTLNCEMKNTKYGAPKYVPGI